MTKTFLMPYDDHVMQFRADGWFNATVAAEIFGKRPVDWLALESTKEYITALMRHLGISEKSSLIRAKRNSGTWLHPRLAVAFARWLDVNFAVWCDTQIETIIHGNPGATDWYKLRHAAASSYKVMSDVLFETRAAEGKNTAAHHYVNEAKLVNRALTGEFQPLERSILSSDNLDLLIKLESRNAVLIARGVDRDRRKTLLAEMAENYRAKLAGPEKQTPRSGDSKALKVSGTQRIVKPSREALAGSPA